MGISPIKADRNLSFIQWCLYGTLLILLIGFRHEVGGDWDNYIINNEVYTGLSSVSFFSLFDLNGVGLVSDIGFLAIHWISMNYFNGIYATNFIMAIIFILGLFRLCRNMPIPWLALTISVPYLIVVVSMGYTRQSAAIGLILWGLVDLMHNNKGKAYFSIITAVLFHKTAIFMLPIIYFSNHPGSKNSIKHSILIILFLLIFSILLYSRIEYMVYSYLLPSVVQPSGSTVRILLNILPAVTFLSLKKAWSQKYKDAHVWTIFSIMSFLLFLLNFVTPIAADRLSLYLMPLQIVVFSRIPSLISDKNIKSMFVIGVILLYIAILFVWLYFGVFSKFWLPYNNILF